MNRLKFLGGSRYVYIGNNALEQLGVISRDSADVTLLDLIDKTSTVFGKRLLKERLLNPICYKELLSARYDLSEKLLDVTDKFDTHLKQIYDLERIQRRIKLGKLHPVELTYITMSLHSILNLLGDIKEKSISQGQAGALRIDDKVYDETQELKRYLEKTFCLDTCARFRIEQINDNIFQEGVYPAIDTILGKSPCHRRKCYTQTHRVEIHFYLCHTPTSTRLIARDRRLEKPYTSTPRCEV